LFAARLPQVRKLVREKILQGQGKVKEKVAFEE